MTFCSISTSARAAFLGVAATAAVAFASCPASAEALLLIEADTGKVLHAENATQPWYPASVTKLMTAYVTLRAVREGRITLDKLITISAIAAAQQPSKMGIRAGLQVTVDNALKMLMVHSANDMAVVLAEGVSGSIENFATEMNRAARRLGMTQTSYVNPNGLPADGQITSARDLGILARALIREFPEYDFYWHISAIQFGKRVMRNYNALIDRYPGADGMKTGFICASGYNLVASATRGGRRLIAVVLGARSGAQRAEKAARLLEQGFTGGGLNWLLPSLGTVDALQPVVANPPNLRDEVCGGNRRRPPSDNPEEDDPTANREGNPSVFALMSPLFRPNLAGGSLLGPLIPSMAPIPVYVGPGKKTPNAAIAAAPKKKSRTAALPAPAGPPSQAAAPPPQAPAAPAQAAAPPPQPAAAPPANGPAPAPNEFGKILPANKFAPADSNAMALQSNVDGAAAPAASPAAIPLPRARPKRPAAPKK